MTTLLVSDIHLGAQISRAGALLTLLESQKFDRLILIGDIFSDLNFARLSKEHFRLLAYLRKLSNPKRGIEVVWIEGNHDIGLVEVLSHLVGIPAYEEYRWEWNGKKCVAIHGHQFDHFMMRNLSLTKWISFLILELQKIPVFRRRLAVWLDQTSTSWSRISEQVASGAFKYARQYSDDVVFCGHTHVAMQEEKDGIQYFNPGCWVGSECGYIRMTDTRIIPTVVQTGSES